ncbi:Cardiolipin synthase B [Candidatus Nitrotoga sp. HW29]|uniref:cardiolipin synthase ClsB n=1 Tax=Candidatus Nitrotoga sp. HW29 TaxID=2886963 RepID=UPI001EF20DA8|nr:cardiolipin synthase ClsB [Candidatus Nitrotoga sp. HW29]CAH1905266.1 Cardiolipin synthase B [Candidatus Nitrotoga sp. HW29]
MAKNFRPCGAVRDARSMSSTHLVDGHILILLRNGEEYFPHLIAAIDAATRTVYLETYIYAADTCGRLVSQALQRAAKRGVRVHLLLDGYGSADLPDQWVNDLREAGVEVLWYRPEIARFKLRRHRLRRLHRKLALVDGTVAFVSGVNIINDVPGGQLTAPRLDYTVQVQGVTVDHIQFVMRRLWTLVSWISFRRQRERIELLTAHKNTALQKVAFVLRDNLRHRHDIEHAYLKAIARAQREIIIANAYFLPGTRFRHALLNATRRGVRVVLLLQGRVEYRLQHFATRALYDELLRAGIEIHEYYASFMHAKVAVVDGNWATVGSSNIDPFSLWLAREANLVVRDAGFAESLRADLLQEIAHGARLISHSVWREHSMWMHLLMRISYAMVRFLTGVIGYARGRDNV